MMKKIIIILLLATTLVSGMANAGLYNLTYHSRASCGNNETISWHAGHSYWLWTVSRHRNDAIGQDHQVIMDWELTWRSAAVHWGEGTSGWTVEGHHWIRNDMRTRPFEAAQEYVTDCSIYDGWWS